MKILHVITTLQTGGAEKLMVDLLPRLRQSGFDVDLCIFNGEKTEFYKQLESSGIKIYDFGENNSVYNPVNIFKLRKLIKAYDIVHTHNTSPQFYSVLANIGIGRILVTTEHNTHNRRRDWPGFSIVDSWFYRRYKTIITISRCAEINLRKYLRSLRSEILTINNGIDISLFEKVILSSEWEPDLAPDARIITMVAGFRPQKDHPTLIRALKHLPENFHAFLIGDGPLMNEMRTLVSSLDLDHRVHFLGVRTDVPALLKASDYIVMASNYEGLSLSSVEGMCARKPFLASDVDGLREVVKGAGILFTHKDSKMLADEILRLENSPETYDSVSQKCHERARQFDISNMVEGYEKTYRHLFEKSATR